MADPTTRKAADLLRFGLTGQLIGPEDLPAEFAAMLAALEHLPGPGVLRRVGAGSGSHLLKLVSPRADGSGGKTVVLRSDKTEGNRPRRLLPSLNAPDTPVAKLVYRPLEVTGAEPRGLVAHLREPDAISPVVEDAFSLAYGRRWLELCAEADDAAAGRMRDEILAACGELAGLSLTGAVADDVLARRIGRAVLTVLRVALTEELPPIRVLPARECPIVFLPRPGGGDLQVTPLSPAGAFSDMAGVRNRHFSDAEGGPGLSRGNWVRQHVSAKPQNISGAISQSRNRFFARMPPPLRQSDAELYRFVHGGHFPRWQQPDVDLWLWRYGDMLAQAAELTTIRPLRLACDRMADRLIADAMDFATETLAEARDYAAGLGLPADILRAPEPVAIIGHWRGWSRQDELRRTQILASAHFRGRLTRRADGEGD